VEYRRLADAWSSDADREAPASALEDDSEQLARLLAGIQRWESAAAKASLTGEGIEQSVAGNVERYLGVSLVLLGELGLLMAAYYYLPWPWNSVVWYISLPASCAFALAKAYRLETIFQAVTGGSHNPEVRSST